MMMGESGTGKTYSLRTLLDAGITPFVLFTDPGMESIADAAGDPKDCRIHWRFIAPANPSWNAMIDSATKIHTLSFSALTKLQSINKQEYGQFIEILRSLANFQCERCGREFGAVDDWNTDRAIVIDNLTGLSDASMKLVVGSKPVKAMSDWGLAMDNVKNLVERLSMNLHCMFVLIAHLERETDETTGAVRNMASTLGRKLAPVLPRTFSDVFEAVREGNVWTWRTDSVSTATKARNLPYAGRLDPTFVQIVESWKSHGGRIEPTEDAPVPTVTTA